MSTSNGASWGPGGPFGEWRVQGRESSGEKKPLYEGTLVIESVLGPPAIRAYWKTEAEELTGLGLLHHGRFLLSRVPGKLPTGQEPGIVWYALTGAGDLDAVWSYGTLAGQIGTGRAQGGTPGKLEGKRTIRYYLPNGNLAPPGSLDVEITYERSELYSIEWKRGDTVAFDGIGHAIATGLTSSWTPTTKPRTPKTLVVADALPGGRAVAKCFTRSVDGEGAVRWELTTETWERAG